MHYYPIIKHFLHILLLFISPLLVAQEVASDVDSTRQELQDEYFAPLQVQQLGQHDFDELTRQPSSLDLQTPDNIKTEVEYQPQTGYYIMHTKIGDVDITTPYMMNSDEYNEYNSRRAMQLYWQE